MTVISFELNQLNHSQYNLVKINADFEGINITTYIKYAILEKAQDALDYRDAANAEHKDHGQTVSREAIMKELGMNPNR